MKRIRVPTSQIIDYINNNTSDNKKLTVLEILEHFDVDKSHMYRMVHNLIDSGVIPPNRIDIIYRTRKSSKLSEEENEISINKSDITIENVGKWVVSLIENNKRLSSENTELKKYILTLEKFNSEKSDTIASLQKENSLQSQKIADMDNINNQLKLNISNGAVKFGETN